MYIPRNWEFGPAFSKLRNFGGGFNPPNTPPGYASGHLELQVCIGAIIKCRGLNDRIYVNNPHSFTRRERSILKDKLLIFQDEEFYRALGNIFISCED
jgi:hypothetical protein